MQIINAAVLGVVEGLTEFLPISSTGHLIVIGSWLDFKENSVAFKIAIQLGAILAVCFKYRQRIIYVAETYSTVPASKDFVFNIAVAFLPAMIIGGVFHKQIEENFFTPMIVAIMLIFGGCLIVIIENNFKITEFKSIEGIDRKTAFSIGLFQCIAMIPGISRSGATIMGSLLMGVSRPAAAEFSFFLAIPTMIGATLFTLIKHWNELTVDSLALIAVGFVVAFISALLVVSWLVDYVSRHGFKLFAYYRIVVGSILMMAICLKQAGYYN